MKKKGKISEQAWDEWYKLAKTYYKKNGDLRIPRNYVTQNGKKLGRWIERQWAAIHGKGTYVIYPDQIRLLDAIDMKWNLGERKDWDFWYERAKEYYNAHGNLVVPRSYKSNGYALGNWIGEQRRNYWKGSLSSEKIGKLEAISIDWKLRERRNWEEWYFDAVMYSHHFGNLEVPLDYKTAQGRTLGSWIERQRETYWMTGKRFSTGADHPLTEKQIHLLERIGMRWNGKKWRKKAAEINRFRTDSDNAKIMDLLKQG